MCSCCGCSSFIAVIVVSCHYQYHCYRPAHSLPFISLVVCCSKRVPFKAKRQRERKLYRIESAENAASWKCKKGIEQCNRLGLHLAAVNIAGPMCAIISVIHFVLAVVVQQQRNRRKKMKNFEPDEIQRRHSPGSKGEQI